MARKLETARAPRIKKSPGGLLESPNLRYNAAWRLPMALIIANYLNISITFPDFSIKTRRFILRITWNCLRTSHLILDGCIFEYLVSHMTLGDCLAASCKMCCILCLPLPVGLLSSQKTWSIKKSGVLWAARKTNSMSFPK